MLPQTWIDINISVGTVLIYQFSPGSATEAAVPRFWFLLLDTRVSILGFHGFSWLGSISVPFSASNQVEPKALVLEPKLTGNLNCEKFSVPK